MYISDTRPSPIPPSPKEAQQEDLREAAAGPTAASATQTQGDGLEPSSGVWERGGSRELLRNSGYSASIASKLARLGHCSCLRGGFTDHVTLHE